MIPARDQYDAPLSGTWGHLVERKTTWRCDRFSEPACWLWEPTTAIHPKYPIWSLREWHRGRCAVCGENPKRLLEDHEHGGFTRGFLCTPCNVAEGTQNGVYRLYRMRTPAAILGVRISYIFCRPWPKIEAATADFPPSRVLDMSPATADLVAAGRRRLRAKAALEKATEAAKAAAMAAAADGISEVEIAEHLKVDRMTVRSWLGKRRP